MQTALPVWQTRSILIACPSCIYILVFILYVCLCAGPCLFESGLIPKRLSFREDAELLNYGIGITNIVPRTTRAANELSKLV